MKKEIVEVPVLSAAVRAMGVPLSLVTRGGGLVFVSGTPPLDIATGKLVKGDIEAQTEASLIALNHCLQAAGATLEDVLMVRIYAVNAGFYGTINRVYARHFPESPPARTFVTVASWPLEFDIEIECVALGQSSGSGSTMP
jgi:enamine deaminase RidA (YjgF/YER057c/UK114 family)